MIGLFEPFVGEKVTVSTPAVGFTSATYAPATGRSAKRAVVTVEGGEIRWWATGTDPTTTVGHSAMVGDVIVLEGPKAIRNFRAIRAGATDGVIQVTFER